MRKLKIYFLFAFFLFNSFVNAQPNGKFFEKVEKFRAKYQRELVRDLHSPLTKYDLRFLHFYAPDSVYNVNCKITKLQNQDFFNFMTSSGQKRKYRKFAKLSCIVKDTAIELFTYESERLLKSKQYKDYIFLPFTDNTNGEATYGGGRYLDLQRKDFSTDEINIDFNLCYNPYCAYSSGYSCAIPPKENYVPICIEAGEKLYTGIKKHRSHRKQNKKQQKAKLKKQNKKLKERAKKSILKRNKTKIEKSISNPKIKANKAKRYYEPPSNDKMKIEKK